MTEQTVDGEAVWTFGPGDRLRKAREIAGYDQQQFSKVTEMARDTIRKWEAAHVVAPKRVLSLYATSTPASLKWLETGELNTSPPDDGGRLAQPPTEANHRTTAYKSHGSRRGTLRIAA